MPTLLKAVVAAGWLLGLTVPAPTRAEDGQRIVHIEIAGALFEAPPSNPFGLQSSKMETTRSLMDRLRALRQDDSVAAVFMTFEAPSMGLAQIQELRQAIEQVKSAGKEVYVHMDGCGSSGLYWLATSASRVAIVPTGDVWLTGLLGQQLYLKDMLANLRLSADVIHIGDFKSAGELFSRTEPSEPAAQQMNWLFDSLYGQMVTQIAAARATTPEKIRQLIDDGPYTAETAKAAGLIDDVAYRMDFVDWIKERHGNLAFDKNYGRGDAPSLDFANPFAIFELFNDMLADSAPSDQPQVALIYVEGAIMTGEGGGGLGGASHGASSPLRKALYRAARDPQVKAVVLRVDSPGGSALASEIIWNATQQVVAAGKPFVVSMGNTAASGGYYVSCGADTIFAEAGTITGSIGVVSLKFVTRDMWDWIGVDWYKVQRGANADMLSGDKPFTDHGRRQMTRLMEDVYGVFKDRILARRRDRLKQPLDEIAGGRVYTGEQAKELGLIDRVGGLQDAMKHAALEASLGDDYDVRILPKPKTIMDLLMDEMGFESDARLSDGPERAMLSVLRRLEPQKVAAFERMLVTIDAARRDGVLAVMPFAIVFE